MENQKIINSLDKIDTNSEHFTTKKWYIINELLKILVLIIHILLSTILEY